ncbi:MAG: C40 family peptidase [Acidimicrobiales bacterium]
MFAPARRRAKRAVAAVTFVATGALLAALVAPAAPSFAAAGPAPAPPAPTTTTTLPAMPTVAPDITDGVSPQALLSNAVTLSAVGIDTTALQAAIAATQAKLDDDALTASHAAAAAAAADQRAAAARQRARRAQTAYNSLAGAVEQAAVYLYVNGPSELTVNPSAGDLLAYAADYEDSALTPTGALAERRDDADAEKQASAEAKAAKEAADHDSAQAAAALASQQTEEARLKTQLASMSAATAAAVAADHTSLASQAGTELLSATSLQFTPATAIPPPVATTPVALAWAFSELGQPYVWGATGPSSFDCSGLTQYVWHQAGVDIPRVAADQYAWTVPIPLSDLLPGDLVFYGRTDIHHVGIYIGDGLMINAPHTGDVVRVSSIWWSDLAGFGRVHATGVPVPAHQPPSAQKPVPPEIVVTAEPVPAQTKPPPGWVPSATSTSPIAEPASPGTGTTTTTVAPASTTTSTVPVGSTTTTLAPASTTTTTVPVVAAGGPTTTTTLVTASP